MSFPISPGVNVREIDLTTGTPVISTSIGATCGQFNWGPVDERVLISSEVDLRTRFQKPDDNNFPHYYTAANFLSYSNNLRVVRVVDNDTALNSTTDGVGKLVKNQNEYVGMDPDQGGAIDSTANRHWIGKYPGDLGNSLGVSLCPADKPEYTLTGNVSITGTSVVGSDSLFDDELEVGDTIVAGANSYIIASITSNTGASVMYANGDVVDIADAVRSTYSNFEANGSGTISMTANSTEIIGTGTNFSGDINVGDVVVVGANTVEITGVTNATHMTTNVPVSANAVASGTDYIRRWKFALSFDQAPTTSAFAATANGTNDECHIVVYDYRAVWSGVEDEILESYENVSVAKDAKSPEGSAIYYKARVNNSSTFVSFVKHPTVADNGQGGDWGQAARDRNFTLVRGNFYYEMSGGSSGDNVSVGDLLLGWDLFNDVNAVTVSILAMGKAPEGDGAALANHIINIAEQRKDAVALISPEFGDVVMQSGYELSNLKGFRNSIKSSTYAILDTGYGYQYDKYNDTYRWVPLNGDLAGICARTDQEADTWFSPAGFQRGLLNNPIKLAFNPIQAQRDELYRIGYNPVVAFPGQGVVLFGDKTLSPKPSAFDRINVRRLFIYMEKVIGEAARTQLFQFNNAFTRGQFQSLVEGFLRGIAAGQGIQDYAVVCDDTNNTPDIIDSNKFVADIFVKPTKSINFIRLSFVAVRSGVSFSEAIGAV